MRSGWNGRLTGVCTSTGDTHVWSFNNQYFGACGSAALRPWAAVAGGAAALDSLALLPSLPQT